MKNICRIISVASRHLTAVFLCCVNFPGCLSGRDETNLITSHCGWGRVMLSVAASAALFMMHFGLQRHKDPVVSAEDVKGWHIRRPPSGPNASECAHFRLLFVLLLLLFESQLLASGSWLCEEVGDKHLQKLEKNKHVKMSKCPLLMLTAFIECQINDDIYRLSLNKSHKHRYIWCITLSLKPRIFHIKSLSEMGNKICSLRAFILEAAALNLSADMTMLLL